MAKQRGSVRIAVGTGSASLPERIKRSQRDNPTSTFYKGLGSPLLLGMVGRVVVPEVDPQAGEPAKKAGKPAKKAGGKS